MGVECSQTVCLAKGIKHCGYHVCILGCIASGKSTWARALLDVITEKEGRCEGLWEPVETNPLLPLYYQDPKRYAFSMQVNMLNKRYEQQLVAQDLALAGISSVQDSSMFGDSCFVEMLKDDGILCNEEVTVYGELFANMSRNVMYPSLVVYLDCPPEKAKERVIKRGRECEKDISIYYLASLKLQIEKLIKEFYRYTFVKEINVSCDMTPEEIKQQAYLIYDELQMMRNKPILSRMGV